MPTKIRMTQRRSMKLAARDKAIRHVVDTILPDMQWQYRVLKRELRRANLRKTIRKIAVPASISDTRAAALYKVEVMLLKQSTPEQEDKGTWQKWVAAFLLLLTGSLLWSADELGNVENDVWVSRGLQPVVFDAQSLVNDYQSRIGRQISEIGPDTLQGVQQTIADWYLSDATFSDLVNRLGRYFDEQRAMLIARTEVGNLDSQVSLATMRAYGITRWRWDALGPNPCDFCLPRNGLWFSIAEPMPPDAAHPGCYCLPYFNPEDTAFLQ